MIISSVTCFVKQLSSYTDQDLVALTSIEGYGMVYTGSGDVRLNFAATFNCLYNKGKNGILEAVLELIKEVTMGDQFNNGV